MVYRDMESVRCRANKIGRILNEATNYGRRPLPIEFADLHREWIQLADIKPVDTIAGVEVIQANHSPT